MHFKQTDVNQVGNVNSTTVIHVFGVMRKCIRHLTVHDLLHVKRLKCELFLPASLVTPPRWNSAVFVVPTIVRSSWIIKTEVARRVPRSLVRSKSSFMLLRPACARVEAGAVAGQ